jgi:hypothetical protein
MGDYFDDSVLDDPIALDRIDPVLRSIAEAGARVRRQAVEAAEATEAAISSGSGEPPPRAIVAAGPDSRLLRAVLEPWCPVPFVAWPNPSLPGWAGALDLVLVLAPVGSDAGTASAVAEAVRRGCRVVVACPRRSLVAEHAVGRDAVLLPADSGDQLATAVIMLLFLARVGLGPETSAESVAAALDDVAVSCSPQRDLAVNPAKTLAIALAEGSPLLWGGTALAARAARRVSEAIRRSTGRAAIAADAEHLLPLIRSAPERDVFADPFADDGPGERPPVLVIFDDGSAEVAVRDSRGRLTEAAEAAGVRLEVITSEESDDVAKYAALLATGSYVAAYLGLGLSR